MSNGDGMNQKVRDLFAMMAPAQGTGGAGSNMPPMPNAGGGGNGPGYQSQQQQSLPPYPHQHQHQHPQQYAAPYGNQNQDQSQPRHDLQRQQQQQPRHGKQGLGFAPPDALSRQYEDQQRMYDEAQRQQRQQQLQSQGGGGGGGGSSVFDALVSNVLGGGVGGGGGGFGSADGFPPPPPPSMLPPMPSEFTGPNASLGPAQEQQRDLEQQLQQLQQLQQQLMVPGAGVGPPVAATVPPMSQHAQAHRPPPGDAAAPPPPVDASLQKQQKRQGKKQKGQGSSSSGGGGGRDGRDGRDGSGSKDRARSKEQRVSEDRDGRDPADTDAARRRDEERRRVEKEWEKQEHELREEQRQRQKRIEEKRQAQEDIWSSNVGDADMAHGLESLSAFAVTSSAPAPSSRTSRSSETTGADSGSDGAGSDPGRDGAQDGGDGGAVGPGSVRPPQTKAEKRKLAQASKIQLHSSSRDAAAVVALDTSTTSRSGTEQPVREFRWDYGVSEDVEAYRPVLHEIERLSRRREPLGFADAAITAEAAGRSSARAIDTSSRPQGNPFRGAAGRARQAMAKLLAADVTVADLERSLNAFEKPIIGAAGIEKGNAFTRASADKGESTPFERTFDAVTAPLVDAMVERSLTSGAMAGPTEQWADLIAEHSSVIGPRAAGMSERLAAAVGKSCSRFEWPADLPLVALVAHGFVRSDHSAVVAEAQGQAAVAESAVPTHREPEGEVSGGGAVAGTAAAAAAVAPAAVAPAAEVKALVPPPPGLGQEDVPGHAAVTAPVAAPLAAPVVTAHATVCGLGVVRFDTHGNGTFYPKRKPTIPDGSRGFAARAAEAAAAVAHGQGGAGGKRRAGKRAGRGADGDVNHSVEAPARRALPPPPPGSLDRCISSHNVGFQLLRRMGWGGYGVRGGLGPTGKGRKEPLPMFVPASGTSERAGLNEFVPREMRGGRVHDDGDVVDLLTQSMASAAVPNSASGAGPAPPGAASAGREAKPGSSKDDVLTGFTSSASSSVPASWEDEARTLPRDASTQTVVRVTADADVQAGGVPDAVENADPADGLARASDREVLARAMGLEDTLAGMLGVLPQGNPSSRHAFVRLVVGIERLVAQYEDDGLKDH